MSEAWHTLHSGEVLERLRTSPEGLSEDEAARRLADVGPNALKEAPPTPWWRLLVAQFASLLIWILLAAALVSGLMGEWMDATAILVIIVLNGLIGFYQEYSAGRAIEALRRMTAPHARVRRDGELRMIPAVQVVPGDVLALEAGDLVPADARLLSCHSLKAVESALTGESEAAAKQLHPLPEPSLPVGDRSNLVFMGTSIAAGRGEAVVVATGMRTEFGHIAGMLEAAPQEVTPLQQRLEAVGRVLVWASLAIVGVLFILGLLRHLPAGLMFLTAVSLAVAAVPEGLPAVVTIALALGVQRMSRRRALIRHLPAVETLGSTNVICTDKTGTLTVGEMTVRELWCAGQAFSVSGEGYGPQGQVRLGEVPPTPAEAERLRELMTAFVGCNGAQLRQEGETWQVVGDPTEGALLTAGAKLGVRLGDLDGALPRLKEHPFDSERKRMSLLRRTPDGSVVALVKGAPDLLLARCAHILGAEGVRPIEDADRAALTEVLDRMGQAALRVLAAARRAAPEDADAETAERDLVFLGLAGMVDPPRPEAKLAVAQCRSAGIRVVMITGDHPRTALAVARELGLEGEVVTGQELDALTDPELALRVPRTAVYARVSAEHKLRVVKAWKAAGGVVAMTGDGVNDAPAIQGADIGVAMGRTGTEVTKEASAMVITDDNFASIVAAVEEGRGVYDNIKKALQYLLGGNLGELLIMAVAILAGLPVPLLPIHLLWINLVTDGLPALALASDPVDPGVMARPPRPRGEQLMDRSFYGWMVLMGVLTAAVTLGVYVWALPRHGLDEARTYALSVLVYAELFRALSCHSTEKPLWKANLLTNLKLVGVVGVSVLMQPWTHHSAAWHRFLRVVPMDLEVCLMLLPLGMVPMAVMELVKWLRPSGEDRA